jgi:hypothetical protein
VLIAPLSIQNQNGREGFFMRGLSWRFPGVVAHLESYANELFVDMNQNFPGVRQELLEKLWSDYERKSILEKFDLALLLREEASMRVAGVESFQSVEALVRLRNALMHFKPEWEPAKHKQLSSELRNFFKPSEFLANDPGLFPRVLSRRRRHFRRQDQSERR